jgi:hypothetical protein
MNELIFRDDSSKVKFPAALAINASTCLDARIQQFPALVDYVSSRY